jgi:hypothetical protein
MIARMSPVARIAIHDAALGLSLRRVNRMANSRWRWHGFTVVTERFDMQCHGLFNFSPHFLRGVPTSGAARKIGHIGRVTAIGSPFNDDNVVHNDNSTAPHRIPAVEAFVAGAAADGDAAADVAGGGVGLELAALLAQGVGDDG